MDAVEPQQVRVGFNRTKVVDGNDFNIGAATFDDSTQDVASDPSKSVDCDFDCQWSSPVSGGLLLSPEGDQPDQIHELTPQVDVPVKAKDETQRKSRANEQTNSKSDPVCHRAPYGKRKAKVKG